MAKLEGNSFVGTFGTPFGRKTIDRRGVVKSTPTPQHLKGVKSMNDTELSAWAKRHGMTFDEAKKIRDKQLSIKNAIEECKKERDADPVGFRIKYPKIGLASHFNICVGKKLSSTAD